MSALNNFKAGWKEHHNSEDYVMSVAAIKTLIEVIQNSTGANDPDALIMRCLTVALQRPR